MSDAWEQSDAARALRSVASLEAGAPPPLSAVREVAGRRAARAATVMALLIAIPVGAMAAGGVYAWRSSHQPPLARREEGRGEGAVRAQKSDPVVKPAQAEVTPLVEDVAPPAPAPQKIAVARPVKSAPLTPTHSSFAAPLTPTGERGLLSAASDPSAPPAPTVTPEIPARGGTYVPPAPARTSLADEAAVLTQALTALRSAHDPAHALELLSSYRSRFPAGALRHEAALAAAEAHRALGHTTDALAALEQAPNRPDLDVLRAELNAEVGQCETSRAIVRELKVSGALLERALFTDATCALTLGAREEAIADLEQLPGSPRAKALLEKLK